MYGDSSPTSANRFLGMGLKSSLPWSQSWAQRWELKTSVGTMLPVSFEGKGVGSWAYGNASVRLPRAHSRQIFGRRTYSTMVVVEQPITRKLGIVSDWCNGR
jgi:hypothetical protein